MLGVTKGIYAKHGNRLMDTPLSESAYIGAAIGASVSYGLTVHRALEAAEKLGAASRR